MATDTESYITVYTNRDFNGNPVNLAAGTYRLGQLLDKGVINDSISSIKIPPGYTVFIWEHNFTGKTTTFRDDTPYVGDEYDEMISSITVVYDENEARVAEEKRKEEERIAAEKAAEEARIAAEKAAEEARIAAEEARVAEEKRQEEERKAAEAARIAEEHRKEEERIAAEKAAEEARIAAEEARIAAEQARIAAEEARIAEEKRKDEERIAAENAAEAARIAEEHRKEDERIAAEKAAKEAKTYFSAMKFDGVKSIISASKPLLNNMTAFTMEGWVKASSLRNGFNAFFGQNNAIELGIKNQKLAAWVLGKDYSSTASFPLQEWHHVALVGDGAKLRFYCDGSLISTFDLAAKSYGTSNFPFKIGGEVWGANKEVWSLNKNYDYFTGLITEVRLWQVARSQADIQADLSKRLSGKEPNLIAYYPLNEINLDTFSPTALDLAGGNHCTVKNSSEVNDDTLPLQKST